MRITPIYPFRGLFTTADLDAPNGFASGLSNVRLGDGKIRPRFGYRNIAGIPTGFSGAYGFGHLVGYNASYVEVEEWLSVESRSGVIKPYSVNPTTGVRTEITNGGTALALDPGDWRGFPYDENSYWINPDSDKTLYRHEVGNNASWDFLQDTTYTPPPPDETLSVTVPSYVTVAFDALDTIVVTSTNGITIGSIGSAVVGGAVNATGSDDDNGVPQKTTIQVTYNAAKNYSGADYICLEVVAGDIFDTFITQSTKARIKIGGVWSNLTDYHQYVSTDRTKYFIVAYVKGLTLTAVQGIEVSCSGHVVRFSSGTACTFRPVVLGGSYIESDNTTKRLWDDVLVGDGVTYGARFATVGGSPLYTAIVSASLTSSQCQGSPIANSTSPLGAAPYLSIVATNSAPWVDDPTGLAVVIQFLRLMEDGTTWKILGTAPNTAEQVWTDHKEEDALAALTTASTVVYTPPDPVPAFSTRGLIGGFTFKGWVIWLFKGGKANVKHSRVGNAEETFSSAATPDPTDLTRPEDFTLADNFADEPIGGVQAGQVAIILGKQGVYAQSGDNPPNMTPPRKVPGSNGCAGRFAFARFRSDTGDPGVAFVDTTGENVWFVGASTVYSGDSQARPTELSSPIRGRVREFLMDQQTLEFGFTDMSPVRMDVDEATNSLWISMGRRAMVLRPPSPLDGLRHWEEHDYALQPSGDGGTESFCTDYAPGTSAASAVRTSWTDDFMGMPYGLEYDGAYATATPLGMGDITKRLDVSGLAPIQPIPQNATLTGATLQIIRYVDDATTPGAGLENAVIDDLVKLTNNGTPIGSNLSAAVIVPESPTAIAYDIDPVALAITLDDVNTGKIGTQLGWDVPGDSHTFDSGNWNISVAPTSPQYYTTSGSASKSTAFVITATYIGLGSPPSFCILSVTATAEIEGEGIITNPGRIPVLYDPSHYEGDYVLDNGIGNRQSGHISLAPTSDPDPVPPSDVTGTKKFKINLTGSSGSMTVTMSTSISVGSGEVSNIVHELSAVIAAPDPATLFIDSVRMTWCYTVPTTGPSLKLSFLAFSPLRKLWTLRSNGMIDELEWNSANRSYVEGSNRDGGLTMPEGFWQSARIHGERRRLLNVGIEREGSAGSPTVTSYCDKTPSGVSSIAVAGLRWVRFPATQVGWWHYVRVSVVETDSAISALQLGEVAATQTRTR